jgi:two-component system LytT family response regulator
MEYVGEAADGLTAVTLIDESSDPLSRHRMPELSGLDGLRGTTRRSCSPAYDKFAVAAFELGVIICSNRLAATYLRLRACERAVRDESDVPGARRAHEAVDQLSGSGPLTRIFVRDRGRILSVSAGDIERLEADDDYVAVISGGRRFLVYLGMNEFESRLDPERFIRVHRSHRQHGPRRRHGPFDATRLRSDARRNQNHCEPNPFRSCGLAI